MSMSTPITVFQQCSVRCPNLLAKVFRMGWSTPDDSDFRALLYVGLGALLVGTATYLLPGDSGAFVILAIVAVLAVAELWNSDVFRLIEARTDAAAANPSSRVTAEVLLESPSGLSPYSSRRA